MRFTESGPRPGSPSQESAPAKEFISPKELEATYGLRRPHTAKMRMEIMRGKTEGALPFIAIGRKILYRRLDVEKFLADRLVGAPQG